MKIKSQDLLVLLVQNDKGQVPAEVVPDPMDMSLDKAEAAMAAKELKQLLLDAVPLSCNLPRATLLNYDNIPGNLMLVSLGLKLGDRVVLDDNKVHFDKCIQKQVVLFQFEGLNIMDIPDQSWFHRRQGEIDANQSVCYVGALIITHTFI